MNLSHKLYYHFIKYMLSEYRLPNSAAATQIFHVALMLLLMLPKKDVIQDVWL